MNHTLRLFFFIFIRIFVFIFLGLNVRRKNLLPQSGPAIIVANHNSHLDTLVLISLFPLNMLSKLKPVAAADYFLENKFISWFALKIIGIIPIARGPDIRQSDPLEACHKALENGDILILFPEGTRGQPEKFSDLKKGVSWLAEKYSNIMIVPVFMYGLGKSMAKSDYLPVPFFCDVFIGTPLFFEISKDHFMAELKQKFQELKDEGQL